MPADFFKHAGTTHSGSPPLCHYTFSRRCHLAAIFEVERDERSQLWSTDLMTRLTNIGGAMAESKSIDLPVSSLSPRATQWLSIAVSRYEDLSARSFANTPHHFFPPRPCGLWSTRFMNAPFTEAHSEHEAIEIFSFSPMMLGDERGPRRHGAGDVTQA